MKPIDSKIQKGKNSNILRTSKIGIVKVAIFSMNKNSIKELRAKNIIFLTLSSFFIIYSYSLQLQDQFDNTCHLLYYIILFVHCQPVFICASNIVSVRVLMEDDQWSPLRHNRSFYMLGLRYCRGEHCSSAYQNDSEKFRIPRFCRYNVKIFVGTDVLDGPLQT